MSTNADVRTAWAAQVLANINSGTNSYTYQIQRSKLGGKLLEKGYYNKIVDFYEYSVESVKLHKLMGKFQTVFTVKIRHTIEADQSGDNYTALQDSFQTINGLVITNLGLSWSSTVDFYEGPNDLTILEGDFDSRSTWIGESSYTAFKLTN